MDISANRRLNVSSQNLSGIPTLQSQGRSKDRFASALQAHVSARMQSTSDASTPSTSVRRESHSTSQLTPSVGKALSSTSLAQSAIPSSTTQSGWDPQSELRLLDQRIAARQRDVEQAHAHLQGEKTRMARRLGEPEGSKHRFDVGQQFTQERVIRQSEAALARAVAELDKALSLRTWMAQRATVGSTATSGG